MGRARIELTHCALEAQVLPLNDLPNKKSPCKLPTTRVRNLQGPVRRRYHLASLVYSIKKSPSRGYKSKEQANLVHDELRNSTLVACLFTVSPPAHIFAHLPGSNPPDRRFYSIVSSLLQTPCFCQIKLILSTKSSNAFHPGLQIQAGPCDRVLNLGCNKAHYGKISLCWKELN